jgi:hypothetical protein
VAVSTTPDGEKRVVARRPRRREPSSEAFKPRGADGSDMQNLEDFVLDDNEEALAPAVVVATVALLAVFVVGVVVSLVGLVA